MRFRLFLALMLATTAHAQWDLQESGITADLRGIDSVGKGIAWASGTNGTVLRTEDGGYLWQRCTVPPGADKLDFRGIQAFDANTAIVMSSGKGDLSRLYKTTNGCQTWKLLSTNQDPDGFWDGLQFQHADYGLFSMPGGGVLAGDPLKGNFDIEPTMDIPNATPPKATGEAWFGIVPGVFTSRPGEAVFAASNSSLFIFGNLRFIMGTGGKAGARVIISPLLDKRSSDQPAKSVNVPIAGGSESAGIFSLFASDLKHFVAVGGDYIKPNDSTGTAAFTANGGKSWTASTTLPHGYRSAVAYDASTKTWITVGPNGTDISTDDGRNWRALKPGPTDAPDADQHWNALSLPFVVGPHGRIGVLNPAAIKDPSK